MKVFISYSSQDAEVAYRVCEAIENNGGNCFIAPRDIRTGYSYAEEILRGLDEVDVVLLLLSERSNASVHVLREIERTVNAGKPILTYKLEDVALNRSLEYFLMPFQWLNADEDPDFSYLLSSLNYLSNKDAADVTLHYPRGHASPVPKAVAKSGGEASTGASEPVKPESAKPDPKRAKKNLVISVIIAICSVALAGGILVAVLFGRGRGYDDVDTKKEPPVTQSAEPEVIYKVGETVIFGTYLNEPIAWRILSIDEDGCAELISKYAITMKAFDAAESGHFYYTKANRSFSLTEEFTAEEKVEIYGSSRWSSSNLRTWLNSGKEVVLYADQEPVAKAMAAYKNGYNNEPGFLMGFTGDELAAMKQTDIETPIYDPETQEQTGTDVTQDMVYILASDELSRLTEADISYYTKPTDAAISQDKSGYYTSYSLNYDVDTSDWWLRDAYEGCAYRNYSVTNGSSEAKTQASYSCVDGIGVRPVIKIDLHYKPAHADNERR